jgi:Na+/phosphate symporter
MSSQTITASACCHGKDCVWLSIIQQIILLEYVPDNICQEMYNMSNKFRLRNKSGFNGDSVRLAFDSFRDNITKKIENNIKELKALKTVFRSFVLDLYKENDPDKKKAKAKKLPEIIKNIENISDSLCATKALSNSYNITDIVANTTDKIVFDSMTSRRRERKNDESIQENIDILEWYEDNIPDFNRNMLNDENYGKYQMILSSELIKNQKQKCAHFSCIWMNVWNILAKECGIPTPKFVPAFFCREMGKISRRLNISDE